MKKLVLLIFVASLFVASPVLSSHSWETSSYYLKNCKEEIRVLNDNPSNKASFDICLAFIEGADRMHTGLTAVNRDNKLYCTQQSSDFMKDIKTYRSIWVKYLENNPQELPLNPVVTFISAMQEPFPCP